MKGKFITMEGGEGSGKTTQAKLLFDALNKAGISALLTREPGGTDGAEEIRKLLVTGETGKWDRVTEILLYFAARRDHVEKFIKPALARGEWVVCDRFIDSTFAYQGYGHGVSLELIKGMHKLTLGDFFPDLTFLFDCDPDIGIDRTTLREKNSTGIQEDRYERMSTLFHRNVRRGFLETAKTNTDRCIVLKSEQKISNIHASVVGRTNLRFSTDVDVV